MRISQVRRQGEGREVRRRRGGSSSGPFAAHTRPRGGAAQRARSGDEVVQAREPSCERGVGHDPPPRPNRARGVASRMVRGAVASVPHGVPSRVLRADLQPLLRERARRLHRQLRSAHPQDVRRMEGRRRGGAQKSARDRSAPEVHRARLNSVGARRGARNRRARAARRPLRRGPPQGRAGPVHGEAAHGAQQRRTLAVVPRGTLVRRHNALHPHRLREAEPSCRTRPAGLLRLRRRVAGPFRLREREAAA